MPESPEWSVMSEEDRSRAQWQWDHHLTGVSKLLGQRFGARHAGASLDELGDGFRFRVYVKDLAAEEKSDALEQLGPEADHVDLIAVRRSSEDLSLLQTHLRDFVQRRLDGAALSMTSHDLASNAVRAWIRPDAPQLWTAVQERFGDAVTVTWGARYLHYVARSDDEGPRRFAD